VIFGYVQLPKRVDALAEDTVENEESIDKLATTVDKYIAVQAVKEEQEDIRHLEQQEADNKQMNLLMKWIEQTSKKDE
jgi:hypothetical protein